MTATAEQTQEPPADTLIQVFARSGVRAWTVAVFAALFLIPAFANPVGRRIQRLVLLRRRRHRRRLALRRLVRQERPRQGKGRVLLVRLTPPRRRKPRNTPNTPNPATGNWQHWNWQHFHIGNIHHVPLNPHAKSAKSAKKGNLQ